MASTSTMRTNARSTTNQEGLGRLAALLDLLPGMALRYGIVPYLTHFLLRPKWGRPRPPNPPPTQNGNFFTPRGRAAGVATLSHLEGLNFFRLLSTTVVVRNTILSDINALQKDGASRTLHLLHLFTEAFLPLR